MNAETDTLITRLVPLIDDIELNRDLSPSSSGSSQFGLRLERDDLQPCHQIADTQTTRRDRFRSVQIPNYVSTRDHGPVGQARLQVDLDATGRD